MSSTAALGISIADSCSQMFTIQITRRHIVAAVSLSILAALLVVGWIYRDSLHPGAAAQAAKLREVTIELDPFIVNLSGDSGRYLRASVTIALEGERNKQVLKNALSPVRDRLILLLSGKTAEKLLAAEGKTELRAEIVETVNDAIGDDIVNTVYFREFLIQ
jgi:flagellar basal body-associated protein FliL